MTYEGCLFFDEAHKAKNLYPTAGKDGCLPVGGTQPGKAVRLLQQRMPSARVVYASATAATDPQHVGYCSRLGLWKAEAEDEIDQDDEAFLKGEEPFDTFIDFLKTIRGSGRKLNNSTALME